MKITYENLKTRKLSAHLTLASVEITHCSEVTYREDFAAITLSTRPLKANFRPAGGV